MAQAERSNTTTPCPVERLGVEYAKLRAAFEALDAASQKRTVPPEGVRLMALVEQRLEAILGEASWRTPTSLNGALFQLAVLYLEADCGASYEEDESDRAGRMRRMFYALRSALVGAGAEPPDGGLEWGMFNARSNPFSALKALAG